MLALAAVLLCAAADAAQNDALVSFSTPGPDKYADGTTVLDGEYYALVWTPANTGTVKFFADGTVEGGRLVLAAPIAKNGRCPKTLFEVENSGEYDGGSWCVYLLDTRRTGADGNVSVSSRLNAVNAAGAVPGASFALNGTGAAPVALGGTGVPPAAAATASELPQGTPSPRVTAVKLSGGNVYVTVKGTVPYLRYALSSGDTPGGEMKETAGGARSGADGEDEEVVFAMPAAKGAAFFKVGADR